MNESIKFFESFSYSKRRLEDIRYRFSTIDANPLIINNISQFYEEENPYSNESINALVRGPLGIENRFSSYSDLNPGFIFDFNSLFTSESEIIVDKSKIESIFIDKLLKDENESEVKEFLSTFSFTPFLKFEQKFMNSEKYAEVYVTSQNSLLEKEETLFYRFPQKLSFFNIKLAYTKETELLEIQAVKVKSMHLFSEFFLGNTSYYRLKSPIDKIYTSILKESNSFYSNSVFSSGKLNYNFYSKQHLVSEEVMDKLFTLWGTQYLTVYVSISDYLNPLNKLSNPLKTIKAFQKE